MTTEVLYTCPQHGSLFAVVSDGDRAWIESRRPEPRDVDPPTLGRHTSYCGLCGQPAERVLQEHPR